MVFQKIFVLFPVGWGVKNVGHIKKMFALFYPVRDKMLVKNEYTYETERAVRRCSEPDEMYATCIW